MSGRQIGLVWRKEIVDTLRDRRTIMAMIVLPLLVYPILIIVISQLGLRQVEKLRASRARVAVLPEGEAPALVGALTADSSFVVLRPADPESALAARDLDAIVRLPVGFADSLALSQPARVVVRVDLSRDRGEEMRERVRDFLVSWREDFVRARLRERELPAAFAKPFIVVVDNAAGARKMGGSLVGRVLPIFLVVMMMTGAFYPAIDVTAGERERGTLETLLVAPANRFHIVMGKFLTVFVASLITTLANMASIAFTVFFLLGSMDLKLPGGDNLASLLDWRALGLVFLVMVPMALLFSALAMLVASFARSFKEAQNYLSPLVIAVMAPAYVSLLPGLEIDYRLALIPVANVVLLSRELLLGNTPWTFFAVTFATLTGLALLLLTRAVSLFGGEAMLGGGSAPLRLSWRGLLRPRAGAGRRALDPEAVAHVFPLVLLGFFYVGTPLQLSNLKLGLAVTQIAIIAGVPLVALRLLRIPIASALRLDRVPRPRVILYALLAAPAVTLLALALARLQEPLLPVPASYRELMERLFSAQTGGGLLLTLGIFAVLPAVCEEILFRGFVLRGLGARLPARSAILWTAVLFGAFHFDIYRLLPTIALGAVLGWMAWTTGSLWPSILVHAANNALALLSTSEPVTRRFPGLAEGALPVSWVIGATVVGGAALWRLREESRPRVPASRRG